MEVRALGIHETSGQDFISRTDADGNYSFDELAPGIYSVVEIQPTGLYDAGSHVGSEDVEVKEPIGAVEPQHDETTGPSNHDAAEYQ